MKYLVLDLETTGLDPNKDQILEVGAIAVDAELNEIARFEAVAAFPEEDRKFCHELVLSMHEHNGLWQETAGPIAQPLQQLDLALHTWLIVEGASKNTVVLAGHSIHFDQAFIKSQLPETAKLLSHRLMDFGALNRFMRDCELLVRNTPPMPHRAMADCEIELQEAREMRQVLRGRRWL